MKLVMGAIIFYWKLMQILKLCYRVQIDSLIISYKAYTHALHQPKKQTCTPQAHLVEETSTKKQNILKYTEFGVIWNKISPKALRKSVSTTKVATTPILLVHYSENHSRETSLPKRNFLLRRNVALKHKVLVYSVHSTDSHNSTQVAIATHQSCTNPILIK